MDQNTVITNRAPVLTLWAAVVAERLGVDWEAALSLGKGLAGLTAQAEWGMEGMLRLTNGPGAGVPGSAGRGGGAEGGGPWGGALGERVGGGRARTLVLLPQRGGGVGLGLQLVALRVRGG